MPYILDGVSNIIDRVLGLDTIARGTSQIPSACGPPLFVPADRHRSHSWYLQFRQAEYSLARTQRMSK